MKLGGLKRNEQGFTALEVLIGLVAIAALLSIAGLILNISNASADRTRRYSVANSLAFAKVQEYELMDFGDIPQGVSASNYEIEDFSADVLNNGDATYQTVVAKVYNEPISDSLYKLTYSIDWTFGNESRGVDYTTMIQIGGVGR